MSDLIDRQAALNALNGCTEIFLNNLPPTIYKTDAVEAVKALPSAQTEYTAVTPEEVAAEVACGSINSSIYWGNILMQIEQMGYVICRRMT